MNTPAGPRRGGDRRASAYSRTTRAAGAESRATRPRRTVDETRRAGDGRTPSRPTEYRRAGDRRSGAHRPSGHGVQGARRAGQRPQRGRGTAGATQQSGFSRFAQEFGWWRVIAIPALALVTVGVLIDVATPDNESDVLVASEDASQDSASGDTATTENSDGATSGAGTEEGPDPSQAEALRIAADELPPGGEYTEAGDGTYRTVGTPGQDIGEGEVKTVRYRVEVENGVNTMAYGGDTAFATMVDATLADPRSWVNDPQFRFIHVGPDDEADTTFQLTSLETTAEMCGSQLALETSCHTTITGESTVVINESRWVRGAVPFEGDLGNYRQYLINHEFGHAIGYASHQPCGGDGQLAPVMMQQTIELNNARLKAANPEDIYPDEDVTCEPNPWPYPRPTNQDPHNPEDL